MLQQAIEPVGKIDRAAVIKELQTGTFQTIVGPIKLKDNRLHGNPVPRAVAKRGVLRGRAGDVARRAPDHVPQAGMACRVRGQFGALLRRILPPAERPQMSCFDVRFGSLADIGAKPSDVRS